jgi:hypothetical protein
MLSKREQPSKNPTQPAVSLTATYGAYEVGTAVIPTWSASLSAGSYTYGPATGITAKTWAISDTDGHTATTASGSFDSFTVGDDTSYTITATATYDAGAIAKDNLGDPSNPTVQIAAGSKSATSSSITGYRSWFTYVGTSLDTIDSNFIRTYATNRGNDKNAGNMDLTIPQGTMRVIIAIPANSNSKTLKDVIDKGSLPVPVTSNFILHTIDVEGLDGYSPKSYNVWVGTCKGSEGYMATTYELQIS